jgi:hypothetical protein
VLRNIIYFIISLVIFFFATIAYGIILNKSELTLDESMVKEEILEFGEVSILIDRSNYRLHLFSDSLLVKSYKVVFGKNNRSVDNSLNNLTTPIGEYVICDKKALDKYHKMLKINFPNNNDLAGMLKSKEISQPQYDALLESKNQFGCVSQDLLPNGEIGIIGTGEFNYIFKNLPFAFNWTNGSIAISNENIDELFTVVDVGTKVTIKF